METTKAKGVSASTVMFVAAVLILGALSGYSAGVSRYAKAATPSAVAPGSGPMGACPMSAGPHGDANKPAKADAPGACPMSGGKGEGKGHGACAMGEAKEKGSVAAGCPMGGAKGECSEHENCPMGDKCGAKPTAETKPAVKSDKAPVAKKTN